MKEENRLENKNKLKLEYAHLMPSLWQKLGELKRAGWSEQKYKVSGETETVQEHTIALVSLVLSWNLDGHFTKEEQADLSKMLEVHDWAEAVVSDEILLDDGTGDYEKLEAKKLARERRAMRHINRVIDNGHSIESGILEVWERFTTSTDKVAVFARQMDKYQAVERALEYEMSREYEPQTEYSMFEDFHTYALRSIKDNFLKQKMEELYEEWEESKV